MANSLSQSADIIKEIRTSRIVDSKTYLIHPFIDYSIPDPLLIESISSVGLLHPPTLIPSSKSSYDIVCGRKRIHAFMHQNPGSTLICRILPQETKEEDLLLFLLEEQHHTSKLSIMEQASFIQLCRRRLDSSTLRIFFNTLPNDRITQGVEYIEQFCNLLTDTQKMIHENHLSEKAAMRLLGLRGDGEKELVSLIWELKMGKSKQLKLIDEIITLCKRNGKRVADYPNLSQLNDILQLQNNNIPQKSSLLFSTLFALNNPHFSEAKAVFKRQVDQLALPKNCTLQHSEAFERDAVTLKIVFNDFLSLKKVWNKLKAVIQ